MAGRNVLWQAVAVFALAASTSGTFAARAARQQAPADAAAGVAPLAWQIALDRVGFSPGLVDGKPGAKTVLATKEFQKARGLPPTGKPDEATVAALNLPAALTTTYAVTDADQQAVTGTPKDWNEKAAMRYLGYASLVEVVGERFHTSRKCLESLNPAVNFDRLKVGDQLTVPAVEEPSDLGRVARLEINLGEKAIRAFDRQDHEVALFHCSIAKDVEKRPTGSARVVVVTPNPAYTFDPKMWPDVTNVTHKLLIPPGPRNPVGMCWVGLSLPGYGIHGTPNPEMIGKTGSHGCFRLTNWDAVRLGRITVAGVPVKFINPDAGVADGSATTPTPTAVANAAAPQPPQQQPALKNVPWDQLLMGAMATSSSTTQPSDRVIVEDSRDDSH